MDGKPRIPSGSQVPGRPFGALPPRNAQETGLTADKRSVRQAPVHTSFPRHPLVLQFELRKQLGNRLAHRLKDISQNRWIQPVHKEGVEDSALLRRAGVLARELASTSEDDDQQLSRKLDNILQQGDSSVLHELLHQLQHDNIEIQPLRCLQVISSYYEQFGSRAVSIFLRTTLGHALLEKLENSEKLDQEEEKKALLGLTQIQARLKARPAHLSDAPLVEYASLYMGAEVNLDSSVQTLSIIWKTLETLIEHREQQLERDQHLEQMLRMALKDPRMARGKALPSSTLDKLDNTDPLARLHLQLKNDPELRNTLDNDQLSHNDLTQSLGKLQARTRQAPKAIAGLKALHQKALDCETTSASQLPPPTLKTLSHVLRGAMGHCSHQLDRQTLTLLKDHLDYQIINQVRRDFETDLYQQMEFLQKPGSSREFTLSVDVGLAISAASVSGLSLGGKLEYTFRVTGNDDTRIREYHIAKPTLKITGGDNKVVSVSAALDSTHAKGRVFRNLQDFVEFHSNDFVPALMSSLSNMPGNLKGAVDVRRAENLHHAITADRHLLSSRLAEMGVLHPGDQVNVAQNTPVNYADFKRHAVQVSATVNALAGVAEGTLTAGKAVTNFKTQTNLLSMLRNNPDKADPPAVDYLSFWVPASKAEQDFYHQLSGFVELEQSEKAAHLLESFREEDGAISVRRSGEEARDWLYKTEARLIEIQRECASAHLSVADIVRLNNERQALRELLKKAMVDQYMERDMYYFTVNAMEGHVGEEAPQKHFHHAKHSMQAVYGAKNRGQYIAAHIYSFHHLYQLYQATFTAGECPVVNDTIFHQVLQQHIEPSLDKPQIHLQPEKHVRGTLTASSVAKSIERNLSGELTVRIPHSGVSLKADFRQSIIGKNVNPDNDGTYFNVGLNIGAGGVPALAIKGLEHALKKARHNDSNFPDITLAEIAPDFLNTAVEAGVRLEFNFVKRQKGWRLQFTRVSGTDSIGISTPDVGIPTGAIGELKIGLGAKVANVRNWWEQPGNNTLTYLYAKFNGWKAGQMMRVAVLGILI